MGIVLTVGCSSQTLSTAVAPSVKTIGADELRRLAASGQEFVLLDVREPYEVETEGTLKNYLHVPLGQLESRISEVPRDVPIVVACERGVRAGRAAALLQNHGYKDVKSTGFVEYRDKGYELVYPKLNSAN
ncbi:MAG: hypothetical protein KIT09_19680 [Bryobacteraceae bacterium]|nr:hypothetical protein [Bryobacteraceae bacterium]